MRLNRYTYDVNIEALPYTLILILAEMSIGSLWLTLASDLRGGVTRGFVLMMALCAATIAGLAWWTAAGLTVGADVDGYAISARWFDPARSALLAVTGAGVIYALAVFMGWDPLGKLAGLVGAIAGGLAIAFLAAMLAPPAWGYPAVLLGLTAGTLAMGGVSVSMVWGHWYLTEGALPSWPLRDLAMVLLAGLVFQAVVVAVNLVVPVAQTPSPGTDVHVALAANPALYLRIGVGIIFPLILAALALATTRSRSMQSATGLLYICMGAVFSGEVLAKGLMFMTGRPV